MSNDTVLDSEPFVWKDPEDDDAPGGDVRSNLTPAPKWDPRNLPGSFLFLSVKPMLVTDPKPTEKLEFPGTFNAIAYDPDFNETEDEKAIKERYKTNPPYLEHLTPRGNTDTAVSFKRTAFSGIFGKNPASYAQTRWKGETPVYLSIFFNGNPRTSGKKHREQVPGACWTTGVDDTLEITARFNENQRIMKARSNTSFLAWLSNSKQQYHNYTVEYYSAPPTTT